MRGQSRFEANTLHFCKHRYVSGVDTHLNERIHICIYTHIHIHAYILYIYIERERDLQSFPFVEPKRAVDSRSVHVCTKGMETYQHVLKQSF